MSAIPVLPHVTVDEEARKADCSICKVGMTMPGVTFGPIQASDMLASFVVQHAVHDKRGVPSGLTAAGNATKAARDAVLREARP